MQYLGGKSRIARAIADVVAPQGPRPKTERLFYLGPRRKPIQLDLFEAAS